MCDFVREREGKRGVSARVSVNSSTCKPPGERGSFSRQRETDRERERKKLTNEPRLSL